MTNTDNTALVANSITISWEPGTNDGSVAFTISSFLLDADGNYTSFRNSDEQETYVERITRLASRVTTETVEDPITGNTLESVSGAALVSVIKQLTGQILRELEEPPTSDTHSPDKPKPVAALEVWIRGASYPYPYRIYHDGSYWNNEIHGNVSEPGQFGWVKEE